MSAAEKVQTIRLAGPQRRGLRRHHVVRLERPAGVLTGCGLVIPWALLPVIEHMTVPEVAALDDGPESSAACVRCLHQVEVLREEGQK